RSRTAAMNPEQKARQRIDQQLEQCGWVVQDFAEMNIPAGPGVAVPEFPLATGEADYPLYADCKAVTDRLWRVRAEAIGNLEKSLADNRPRSLIRMATGSGKTYAVVSACYRLIKFAKARRILFLVPPTEVLRFETWDGRPSPGWDDPRRGARATESPGPEWERE